MKINGFKLKYSASELKQKVSKEMRQIVLIDKDNESYKNLYDGDKKALVHLVNAAKIINDVALEMDHPLNLVQKQALEVAAETSPYAANALKLFNSLNGVAAAEKNIKSGDYKLARPFVMATKGEISQQNELVREWFAYLKSETGRKVITGVGLILPQ